MSLERPGPIQQTLGSGEQLGEVRRFQRRELQSIGGPRLVRPRSRVWPIGLIWKGSAKCITRAGTARPTTGIAVATHFNQSSSSPLKASGAS